MSAIPPKHTPDTSEYESPETGGGLVAMYNAASHANAESFPVLKAFQDYLEAERAQARKRVMQLSIFFAVLMGVVVTGFLSAGIFMMGNMSTVQNKLLDVALAQKAAPAPAPAPTAPASPALEESVKQMSRVTTELQSSLDKKLDGVNAIASQVHDKVASQDGELAKLRAELLKMQAQSAQLKDELVAIKVESKKPAVVSAPQAAQAATAPAPAITAPAITAPAPAITAPAITAPSAARAAAAGSAAPAALAAAAPAKPVNDPRFPPAVKEPPVTPAGVTAPPAPQGMITTAIPLKTKNVGTIPWRVLIPE